ncbi:MAG TPA: UbiD family decarboxylase, partial [bacterium]|nr:UbiD family decarboxylase [bacterium]
MAFPYNDLREFLDQVKGFGELKEIGGVGWDREMGAMSEMVVRRLSHRSPALLFDEIPGYPRGFRCLYGMLNSPRRFALSLGIPLEGFSGTMELLRAYRDKTKNMPLVPPRFVDKGPVTENILEGEDIDVLKFPVPVHHELDGGRYIGTADAVITRDPDSGWINSGTYRMQAVGKNKVTIYISPGKHGRLQMDKYLSKGEPCPLVAIVGVDPLLWVGSRYSVPMGVSEFDYCGGIKGEPMELVRGSFTGLPFPSYSEIVLEGEVVPGEKVLEGPFGEWPGYYAGGKKEEPVMTVKRVYHRNHPILTCTASNKPPHPHLFERCFIRSAGLWEALDKAGV